MRADPAPPAQHVFGLLAAQEQHDEFTFGRAELAHRLASDRLACLVDSGPDEYFDPELQFAAHVHRRAVRDCFASIRESDVSHVWRLVAGARTAHKHCLHKVCRSKAEQRSCACACSRGDGEDRTGSRALGASREHRPSHALGGTLGSHGLEEKVTRGSLCRPRTVATHFAILRYRTCIESSFAFHSLDNLGCSPGMKWSPRATCYVDQRVHATLYCKCTCNAYHRGPTLENMHTVLSGETMKKRRCTPCTWDMAHEKERHSTANMARRVPKPAARLTSLVWAAAVRVWVTAAEGCGDEVGRRRWSGSGCSPLHR